MKKHLKFYKSIIILSIILLCSIWYCRPSPPLREFKLYIHYDHLPKGSKEPDSAYLQKVGALQKLLEEINKISPINITCLQNFLTQKNYIPIEKVFKVPTGRYILFVGKVGYIIFKQEIEIPLGEDVFEVKAYLSSDTRDIPGIEIKTDFDPIEELTPDIPPKNIV